MAHVVVQKQGRGTLTRDELRSLQIRYGYRVTSFIRCLVDGALGRTRMCNVRALADALGQRLWMKRWRVNGDGAPVSGKTLWDGLTCEEHTASILAQLDKNEVRAMRRLIEDAYWRTDDSPPYVYAYASNIVEPAVLQRLSDTGAVSFRSTVDSEIVSIHEALREAFAVSGIFKFRTQCGLT